MTGPLSSGSAAVERNARGGGMRLHAETRVVTLQGSRRSLKQSFPTDFLNGFQEG